MGTKTFLSYANDLLLPFGETQISSSDWFSVKGPQAVAKSAILRSIDFIMSKERQWPFNRQSGSQTLVVGQSEYDWPSAFREVDMNSFYLEKSDSLNINTTKLDEITKERWYDLHREYDLDNTTDGLQPPLYVFRTSGKYGVTPVPDKAYTLKFTYFSIPTRMSAYDDTTSIPDEFQHVVIDNAIPYTNFFYENDEQIAEAKVQAKDSLASMRSTLINDDFLMRDTRKRKVNG